jgi:hypothetical protein
MSQAREIHGRLRTDFALVRERWTATQAQWQDEVARHFEKEHWQPLADASLECLRAMLHLIEVMEKAE